jgi:hypothetical protein
MSILWFLETVQMHNVLIWFSQIQIIQKLLRPLPVKIVELKYKGVRFEWKEGTAEKLNDSTALANPISCHRGQALSSS